jgi:hypothetical protein
MRRLLVPLLALTLVPAAPAALPNACTLLTNNQAASALGTGISYRFPGGDRRYRTCTWRGVPLADSSYAQPQVVLQVRELPRKAFDRQRARTTEAVGVRGVGASAYWVPTIATLFAWEDGVALTVFAARDAAPLPATRRLATAAFARL